MILVKILRLYIAGSYLAIASELGKESFRWMLCPTPDLPLTLILAGNWGNDDTVSCDALSSRSHHHISQT